MDNLHGNILMVALLWGVLLMANVAAIPLRRSIRRAGARIGVAVDPRAVAVGQGVLLVVVGLAAGMDTFWVLILAVSAAGFRLLTDRFAASPPVRRARSRAQLTPGAVARLVLGFLFIAGLGGGGSYWMITMAGIDPSVARVIVGAVLVIAALSMWQGAMNATRRDR